MSCLHRRLSSLEEEFTSSLSEGEDAISAFHERWQQVVGEVDALEQTGHLDEDLSMLVHIVATRIATLAEISLEIVATRDNLTTELVGELDSLMSELSISDCPAPTIKSPNPLQSTMDTAPPSNAAPGRRKRRKGSEVLSARPTKRGRISNYMSSSSEVDNTPVFTTLTSTEMVSLPAVAPPCSRKRRLSESDISASTTPPGAKRLHIGPRPHAVSDSFICSRDHDSAPYSFSVSSLFTCSDVGSPSIELSGPLDIQPFGFMPNFMSFVDDLPLPQLDLSVDLDLCNIPLQAFLPETSSKLPNTRPQDLNAIGGDVLDVSPLSEPRVSRPILDVRFEGSYYGRSPSPAWTSTDSVDSAPSPPSLSSCPVTPPLHPSHEGLPDLESCLILPEVQTSLCPSSPCDESGLGVVDWSYLLDSFPHNTSQCALLDMTCHYSGHVLDASAGEVRG
ncbi:hypothetical protein V8D89_012915 [Ganoderma adspersum]